MTQGQGTDKGKKPSPTGMVFEYIISQIRTHSWKIGDKIPSEPRLVQELGVSRSAIREVLQQFAALGIVKARQGKGTFLVTDDLERLLNLSTRRPEGDEPVPIKEILVFRGVLEPAMLRLCMSQTEEKAAQFMAVLEEKTRHMRNSLTNTDEFIKADVEFHTALAEFCGNIFFSINLKDCLFRTRFIQRKVNALFGFDSGLEDHDRIIDALKSGDLDRAQEQLRWHLDRALRAYEEEEERRGRRYDKRTGTAALEMM